MLVHVEQNKWQSPLTTGNTGENGSLLKVSHKWNHLKLSHDKLHYKHLPQWPHPLQMMTALARLGKDEMIFWVRCSFCACAEQTGLFLTLWIFKPTHTDIHMVKLKSGTVWQQEMLLMPQFLCVLANSVTYSWERLTWKALLTLSHPKWLSEQGGPTCIPWSLIRSED